MLLLLAPSVGGAQQAAPAASGFNAPTLDGDWRFRVALNGWIPDSIPISIQAGNRSTSDTFDVGDVLDHLGYIVPFDGEVRKGTFGIFVHTLTFRLVGTKDAGRAAIKWDDTGSAIDVGLSYEVGRWTLGDQSGTPVLTVEPFAGARLFYDPIELDLTRLGRSTTFDAFTNYVPVIGIRTFWELTEHLNLRIEADGGGFGVDNNHETWQAVGLVGYRWPGFGIHWNVQAGYRAMRIFDLRKNDVEVQLDARGPELVFALEF